MKTDRPQLYEGSEAATEIGYLLKRAPPWELLVCSEDGYGHHRLVLFHYIQGFEYINVWGHGLENDCSEEYLYRSLREFLTFMVSIADESFIWDCLVCNLLDTTWPVGVEYFNEQSKKVP